MTSEISMLVNICKRNNELIINFAPLETYIYSALRATLVKFADDGFEPSSETTRSDHLPF